MDMKELNKLFNEINKKFGDNTIHFLTEEFVPQIVTRSSGSLQLDLAIGRGGIPEGRIIEVFGPESSGKTTIALLHGVEIQKSGEGLVAFIDAEHAFDPMLAADYGMDLNTFSYIDPRSAENAIDIAEALIRSGLYRLIIIDSVSALTPTKVVESSIEQQTIGLLARFMSTTCQKLNGIAYQNRCTVLFINQIREKVGGFSPTGQTPTTTSGGRALPFYSSLRLNVRRGDTIKEKDDAVGHWMKIKVVKNKVGAPFKEATIPLYYKIGIDYVYEIVELAVLAGLVRQSGAWFSYCDDDGNVIVHNGAEMKWQGKAKLTEYVRGNDIFFKELESKLRGIEVEMPVGAPVSPDGYEDVEEVAEEAQANGSE